MANSAPGVQFVKDQNGNVIGLLGPNGNTMDYPGVAPSINSISYDTIGKISSYVEGGITYTVSYDNVGRVLSVIKQ